jgi:hypothetical protein
MNKNMQIALRTTTSEAKPLTQIINEFIECLLEEADNIVAEFKEYLVLRRKRKEFRKLILTFIQKFKKFNEKKKHEILMEFTKVINKFKYIGSKEETNNWNLINILCKREFNKLLDIMTVTKNKLASHLYPDNSKKIINNQELSDELVAAWGEHAFQKF